MAIRLGMCGFTIGAAAYYDRFPVVEVQQTFYDPPPAMTLERWRLQAPPAFEFTLKAWQVITHATTSSTYRRLKRPFSAEQRGQAGGFRLNPTTLDAWRTTLACARILRATAVLFQCPASFRATGGNVAAMRAWFGGIERPERLRLLWEPRGPWPDELVAGLCAELGLIHAVDPFVRPSLTPAPVTYWRLHGNRSHHASYSDAELEQIRDWIPTDPAIETYVMFNNVPRARDIERFRKLFGDRR